MALYGQDELIKQGYVPAGTSPRQISPSGEVTAFQPSPLNRMATVLNQVMQQQQEQQKKQQEKLAKQFDMYKVLREAGYDPKAAHRAVMNNQFPDQPGGLSIEEQKKQADIKRSEAATKKDTAYANKANKQASGTILSPSLQKAKDDRVSNLIKMSEENPIRLNQLDDAENFLKDLPKLLQGRGGAISFKALQEADPTNPLLSQWQNLKSILTEAQLDYVAKTKGAVSDREMALFGTAVANDDLISVARMTPQLKKMRSKILSDQNAGIRTYKQIYGEDPSSFANFKQGGAEEGSGAQYRLGQIYRIGNKVYKVTGLDDPNDPDFEEVVQ